MTEVIPFGGNTFQGPWNTRRKRQLGQRFLAYVEIEATRASRKDIAKEGRKEGRKEGTNE